MRVHLIRKESVIEFCVNNAQSRAPFDSWLVKVKFADWNLPADMLQTFPGTDLLGNGSNRAVFDIGGNKYRMIVKYAFGNRQVHLFVCWIGTHSEYDKICNLALQYIVKI